MKHMDAHRVYLQLKMLSSIVEFMHKSGVDESAIRESIEKSLAGLRGSRESNIRRSDALPFGSEDLCAELLRLWHRDGRYLDEDAKPRPLALRKGRNSLATLVRRIDPLADSREILREMKSLRMIRRTSAGKYLPTSVSALVGQSRAVERIAKLVVRLVSTVSRNVDPAKRYLPLIERTTWVPDLNPADRQAFADFTQSQGRAYIQMMDDWLEQRRLCRISPSKRGRGEGMPASVHVFAYLDDRDVGRASGQLHGTQKRKPKPLIPVPRAKGPTPPREARA